MLVPSNFGTLGLLSQEGGWGDPPSGTARPGATPSGPRGGLHARQEIGVEESGGKGVVLLVWPVFLYC